jgi:serine protease
MRRCVMTLPLLLTLLATGCRDQLAPLAPTDAPHADRVDLAGCGLNYTNAEVRTRLDALIAQVDALEAAKKLNSGQARALRNHLDNAWRQLGRGEHCAARAQLEAFRSQMQNLVGAGILRGADAQPLIDGINELLEDVPPELIVDASVQPAVPTVPGLDAGAPARPVARFVNSMGRRVDFVANELYLMTSDPAELNGFLGRWNGAVLRTIDFGTLGVTGVAPVYLVRIDPSAADTEGMEERWAKSGGLTGENRVSSDAAVKLLAAALEEAAGRGLKVGINFLLENTAIPDRTTAEALSATGTLPPGPPAYSPNAFDWPYMNRGSPQNIGTAEAWRVLDAMGRLGTRVRIGVADGGFRPNADFPAGWSIQPGPTALRVPNPDPGNCGSDAPTPACTWHGTHVAMAAMGVADNDFGAAGPAGPVGDLLMLQSPAVDFFAVIDYIVSSIPSAIAERPRIINISASTALPTELCLLVLVGVPACETLHGVAMGFRAAGILVFAAAGNQGRNVDETKRFGFWPFQFTEEAELIIPCELSTVLCVGGLNWNATTKHANSNWGSAVGSPNTVRIFGPFHVWSVADAVAADEINPTPDRGAGIVQGTSFATPYVAGVAALIWAANPGLSANQVEQILLGNAHTGSGDPRVPRWVNALGAVRQAVGGNTPPFIRITTPAHGSSHPRGRMAVNFAAFAEDLEGDPLTIRWFSDRQGLIGTGPTLSRFDLDFGTHVITATANDGSFTTTSSSVQIEIFNEPPVVSILTPSAAVTTVCVGQDVTFAATATDLNNPPSFTVPDENFSWKIGVSGPVFATGRVVTRSFDGPPNYRHVYVTAVDEGGLSASRGVRVDTRDCAGQAPTATITYPAADTPAYHDDWSYDGVDEATGLWYKDVTLRGTATDPEDGVLTGEALEWSLQLFGEITAELGTGNEITVRLSSTACEGAWHTIYLRARDSDGNWSTPDARQIFTWTLC